MIVNEVNSVLSQYGVSPENAEKYTEAAVIAMLSDGKLVANPELVNAASAATMKNVCNISFVSVEEYNRCMNKNEELLPDEVMIYCIRREYDDKTVAVGDNVYKVKKKVADMINSGSAAADILPTVFIVMNEPEKACDAVNAQFDSDDYFCRPSFTYSFDVDLAAEKEKELAKSIYERLRELDSAGRIGFYSDSVECRETERADFYGAYGGIFYLGIILSLVFLLATVLIIYYKQITEGYEDKTRYQILQKVGMTKSEIRSTINSQVLTMFFLPLLMAGLHTVFAFGLISKLLMLFGAMDAGFLALVALICFAVYSVVYVLVYKLTSGIYYKIVAK